MWYKKAKQQLSPPDYTQIPRSSLINSDKLFHGTTEDIKGPLRGGGYDNVLWTANTPSIAQTYIPRWGLSTYVHKPSEWDLKQEVTPKNKDEFWHNLAIQYGKGFATDIKYQNNGWPDSYYSAKEPVTYGELVDFLENKLGYKPNYNGAYEVGLDHNMKVRPANWHPPGTLYMGHAMEPLNILNGSDRDEGDLTDLEYHNLPLFERAKEQGYDGIKINDFAQSNSHGNVGHKSIGLLPSGINKVHFTPMQATHRDFPKWEGWDWSTEDFNLWHRNQVQQALHDGKQVPPEVLADYPDLITNRINTSFFVR